MKRLKKHLIDYNIVMLAERPVLENSDHATLVNLLLSKIGRDFA